MAKFEKGHKGLKPKGAKSKKTLILDTFAQSVVEGGMEKFLDELMKLKGSQFVFAYMTLFEYVKPKLSRVDAKTENNTTLQGGLTIQVINPDDNEAITKL